MNSVRQLLQEIARCEIALDGKARSDSCHPCKKVICLQNSGNFQLPEPWSGQIDNAPVLFISSNPSISKIERYPERSWGDEEVHNFFQNRFKSPDGPAAFLKPLCVDGTRDRVVKFWAHARARTAELLEVARHNVRPGIDFALTEIVHCKSEKEIGVREASEFCAQKFLIRVLSLSVAPVFIVYGEHARLRLEKMFYDAAEKLAADMWKAMIGGRERIIVFLPHPASFIRPKNLTDRLGLEGMRMLRSHLTHHAILAP